MTIDACARSGDAVRAEQWLLRMEKAGLHATLACYGTLIGALAKLCEVPRIERIIQQMRQAGLETSTAMYNTLISACARCANSRCRRQHFHNRDNCQRLKQH